MVPRGQAGVRYGDVVKAKEGRLWYNDRRTREFVIWRPASCTRRRACPRVLIGRAPIGRCVAYVYSSTRVVRAVLYACYVCVIAHMSSVR